MDEVFNQLKAILQSHSAVLQVTKDEVDCYSCDTPKRDAKDKPIFFGMVKMGKNKVAFHLMPIYCEPSLIDIISPALRNHMQGKSCFNFKSLEPALFDELASLTQGGIDSYRAANKL